MTEPDRSSASPIQAEPDYTWPFGTKHKLSRRIIAVALVLLLLAPVVAFCFGGEIRAVAWHLRHGNSFVYEGVRLQISADHYVRCWSVRNCSVIYGMGYLRWRMSKPPVHWISLSYMTRTGQDKHRQIDQMRANAFHWKLLDARKILMAGAEMRCEQYLQDNRQNYTISCYSADSPIVAIYMGNGDPEYFYRLLSSAQKQ